jgi:hypothetical protein
VGSLARRYGERVHAAHGVRDGAARILERGEVVEADEFPGGLLHGGQIQAAHGPDEGAALRQQEVPLVPEGVGVRLGNGPEAGVEMP